jgi:hypothetical protein
MPPLFRKSSCLAIADAKLASCGRGRTGSAVRRNGQVARVVRESRPNGRAVAACPRHDAETVQNLGGEQSGYAIAPWIKVSSAPPGRLRPPRFWTVSEQHGHMRADPSAPSSLSFRGSSVSPSLAQSETFAR